MTESHLWEFDRPFPYHERGNYLARGSEAELTYNSWGEFIEDTAESYFGNDENLVYRWDWKKDTGEDPEPDELRIFVVQQYKAYNFSISVAVRDEDEPEVNAWLTERAKKMIATWQPVLRRALDELE